jgi:hypothetical protein
MPKKNPAEILVETYTMGTLTGDAFLELQGIFVAHMGDEHGVDPDWIPQQIRKTLIERGFATVEKFSTQYLLVPTAQSLRTFYLELSDGSRAREPRDARNGRLVVEIPTWAEYKPALGVPQR